MKINSIRYVFENKQPELRRIIVKYGLPPATNSKDLWRKVNYLVAKFKNEMLRDIAEIHPDKELILWSENLKNSDKPNIPEIPLKNIMQTPEQNSGELDSLINTSRSNVKNTLKKEKYSSVCGCSGADGQSCADNCSSAADGDYSNCYGNNCSCGCGNKNQENKFSNAEGDSKIKDNLPVIVLGGLITVGLFLMLKDAPSL